jgi:tetraacyldisaccharide 4'-kinase
VTPLTSPLSIRRRWYAEPGRQHRLQRPVISVGNVSFGGRGKTPLVAHIARILLEAGERPAILARGYGRRCVEDGVVVVSDGTHVLADLDRSGDEPFQLARDVPGARVVVCDERSIAGALAEQSLDATVHVLDDGFQHLQLARDLDLVILSRRDLSDRPIPFGRLREPIDAIERAGAVIVDGVLTADEASALPAQGTPQFILHRVLQSPQPLEPDRLWNAPDRRVVAVAGIAEPDRFARALQDASWMVVDRVDFADHHRYTVDDIRRIADVAARADAPVLTTSKDAVRMLPLRPFSVAVARVPLAVHVEPDAAFLSLVIECLRNART